MTTLLYTSCAPATLISDLPAIRALGFDAVYPAGQFASQGTPELLNAAQAAGLKVILNVRDYADSGGGYGPGWVANPSAAAAALTAYANAYASHPAFYGWYTQDEAEGTTYDVTAQQAVYAHLKSLTPNAPVFAAEYSNRLGTYRATGSYDVYGGDLYPFQSGRTVAQALSILRTQVGGAGVADGTTHMKAAIGGAQSNLTWFCQTFSQTGFPPTGGIGGQVAQLAADGWLTSGHVWAFVWADGYQGISTASSLRGATTAFKNEVKAAFAPYATDLYADATAPSQVTGLTATPGVGQVALDWNDSTDNVAVTGYSVEESSTSGTSGFSQVATTTSSTYTRTGLGTSPTTRWYRVRARDAAGNWGAYSTAVQVTTQAPAIDFDFALPATQTVGAMDFSLSLPGVYTVSAIDFLMGMPQPSYALTPPSQIRARITASASGERYAAVADSSDVWTASARIYWP